MNWIAITDLGDAAIMVPIALAIAMWLLASRAYGVALTWLALFGAAAFLVVCTKIAYEGWCIGVRELDFTGVSGHSMSATSVLPVAGYLVVSRFSNSGTSIAGLLGGCAGVVVGISRIILCDHSWSEVVFGCLLGGSIALAAICTFRIHSRPMAAPITSVFTVAVLILTLHGHRAPSQGLTEKLALYLSGRLTPCARDAHCATPTR
jgi:membrane-associated phospholipid phosphatase